MQTFVKGTDPDIAQVQVQNKLQSATPLLPAVVQQQGIVVTKANASFLMAVGFISEGGKLGSGDMADFVASNIMEPLGRVQGVPAQRVTPPPVGAVASDRDRAAGITLLHEVADTLAGDPAVRRITLGRL